MFTFVLFSFSRWFTGVDIEVIQVIKVLICSRALGFRHTRTAYPVETHKGDSYPDM